MKPVFNSVPHDPPISYGDCFRCAIASILEVSADEIPHPYEFGIDDTTEAYTNRYNAFTQTLKEKFNAWIYFFAIRAEELDVFLSVSSGYLLVGGRSRMADHIVVANNTGVVHDPAGSHSSFGPRLDDTYYIGLVAHGPL